MSNTSVELTDPAPGVLKRPLICSKKMAGVGGTSIEILE